MLGVLHPAEPLCGNRISWPGGGSGHREQVLHNLGLPDYVSDFSQRGSRRGSCNSYAIKPTRWLRTRMPYTGSAGRPLLGCGWAFARVESRGKPSPTSYAFTSHESLQQIHEGASQRPAKSYAAEFRVLTCLVLGLGVKAKGLELHAMAG